MAQKKQSAPARAPAKSKGRRAPAKAAPRAPSKKMTKAELDAKRGRDAENIKQRNQIMAIVIFALAILMGFLVLLRGDNVWQWLHDGILGLFGTCAILWPILLLYISVVTAFERQSSRTSAKIILMVVITLLVCGMVYIFTPAPALPLSFGKTLGALYVSGTERNGAGAVSGIIGTPLMLALGDVGARIVIILLLFVAVMILTGTSLVQLFRAVAKPADIAVAAVGNAHERRAMQQREREGASIDIALDKDELPMHPVRSAGKPIPEKNEKLEQLEKVFGVNRPAQEIPTPQGAPAPIPAAAPMKPAVEDKSGIESAAQAYAARKTLVKEPPLGAPVQLNMFASEPLRDGDYHCPPVSMLEPTREPDERDVTEELQTNGRMLVETLKSFGVQAKIVDISRGPAVTRYELQPAAGVKISKITSLADDLAMNLAASGVRIEAPIPGKAAVGIEVPNKKKSIVRMRDLVESNSFVSAKSRLTVAIGRDIAGAVAVTDLAKMPHLLIAGTTGSGKSVCLNSFIISLLYKSTPDEVRFLMIDPKVVELSIYNGIPQLLVPVVTDPRKAAGALSWAVAEMLKRYRIFADNNVRDLSGYNLLASSCDYRQEDGQPMAHMPQIVILIEELADLMMAAPNEVEDSICRLAQMARAAGMHLVIATQRPSVDVVTGLIKANIPSRIALSVSSQVDSRTIIDMGGAEKLLGNGDMLFAPVGSQKPIRLQGAFVSEAEIESVVGYIKKLQDSGYDEKIIEEIEKNAVAEKGAENTMSGDDADPMMAEAVKCVVEAGQASTSLLQRRLRLGYARAGRLIDEMEQMGVVGPHEGSKPRQVLITYQQWLEMTMRQADEGLTAEDSRTPNTRGEK